MRVISLQSNFESAKKRALTACFCRSKMHIAKVCWFPRIDKSRSQDNRMELPDGWSLKKSRLGQKAFIHAETNTKIFEVPDENTIFELAKARPKKYKAFLKRINAEKASEINEMSQKPAEIEIIEEPVERKQDKIESSEENQAAFPTRNGEFFLAFIKKN